MSTLDGGAPPEDHGFRVPRLLRAADVLFADGRRYRGRVFLPAAAQSHAGAMRFDEWLEETGAFFPFLPDGEGRPIILNQEQLVVVTVPAAELDEDADLAVPRRLVLVECGSLQLGGDVLLDMPADHMRVLDVLNRPGLFLEIRDGERRHYVRKSRVTRVAERLTPAPPA